MISYILYTALAGLVILPLLLYARNPYLWTDLKFEFTMFRISKRISKFSKQKPFYSILDCFLDRVARHPDKQFIIFEDRSYTYSQADKESNRVARALRTHGHLKEGDTVALFLGNEPLFVWLWLALAKLGCTAALLNYNIRSKSLLHCFSCCDAKVLVAGADLQGAVEEVLPSLQQQGVRVFILSESCDLEGLESFSDKIQQASDQPLSPQLRSNIHLKSTAAYIYTSGTTGITVILKRKFSASQFWDDCRKYQVTVIQYIGEIMRYLCNTPKRDNDKDHKVRLAIGNGTRADIWTEFLQRFGDIRVFEFYGSTEGNLGFCNNTGKIGAVGKETLFYQSLCAFIKYDKETGEPVKDSNGFCIKIHRGETGLLIGKIGERTPFIGYAKNKQETEKKKLWDVFEKGDVYFNTGDLLKVDKEGFFYFHDRLGDTFRWKGENVATTEVADILIMVDCIEDANVYGVKVPGSEGRIGMAAVQLKEKMDFDRKATYEHVKKYLPSYARPRFIRIQEVLPVTGTFKHQKVKLAEEGFNPAVITEPLFYLQDNQGYIPMTQQIFNSITNELIRL